MLSDLVNRCQPLPADVTLLVLGAGFSGSHFAALARQLGTRVLTSMRLPADSSDPSTLRFDSQLNQLPDPEQLQGVTHVLSTVPPERDGQDPVIRCLGDTLQRLPLQWLGYLSTTGVYGDRQGAWVRESDPATPMQERSQRRLACEEAWQRFDGPVQILRLPGIYGPGRSPFQAILRGDLQPIDKPGQVFSRVHVDDIAGACWHLIQEAAQGRRPPIVNISDDEPAPSAQIQGYAAELLGITLPQARPYSDASQTMSAMARSFWAENRRVSNALLCEELGYTLLHPTFRSGLLDCWKAEGFKASAASASKAVSESKAASERASA